MKITTILLLLAGLLATTASAADAPAAASAKAGPDLKPDWPQANGPFGNFNPRQYGCKLLDDLSQAKAVWTSEDNDLGYGKTSSGGGAGVKSLWPGHPGSVNALIVAEGKVFASSFRPAGEVWAEEFGKAAMASLPPERQARLKSNTRIDADDFVLAIDQATGKTVWKTIEERKGFFRAMGKRGGWGVSPAYYAGPSSSREGGTTPGQAKVFSMGTTGRLYCYEARTGKKVWESDIGKTHQEWEAKKKECLEKKELPAGGQQVSLVVADGVLIVPLYDGLGNVSLGGVDVQTGKMLWQVANATAPTATPALWRHQGREYVLAATQGDAGKRDAKLRLIAPRDGKVLWTVDGVGDTHFSLAPSEEHVLVNVGSKTTTGTAINGHDANKFWMLLGCYRLSLESAKLVWTMPDELEVWHEPSHEASEWRKYLIRDGKVYYYSVSRTADSKSVCAFFIFDEDTGKVLHRKRREGDEFPMCQQSYLIEDRMLTVPNASHTNITMRLWTTDPKDLRPLSAEWKPPHQSTTGYNVFMEFPYVDGRIFIRALDGTVRCYDLRAPAK